MTLRTYRGKQVVSDIGSIQASYSWDTAERPLCVALEPTLRCATAMLQFAGTLWTQFRVGCLGQYLATDFPTPNLTPNK